MPSGSAFANCSAIGAARQSRPLLEAELGTRDRALSGPPARADHPGGAEFPGERSFQRRNTVEHYVGRWEEDGFSEQLNTPL